MRPGLGGGGARAPSSSSGTARALRGRQQGIEGSSMPVAQSSRGQPSSTGAYPLPGSPHPAGQQRAPSVATSATTNMTISSGLPDDEIPGPRPPWAPSSGPIPPGVARDQSEREKPPKLVKVRLSVHYRVHSRQMLCIGGSQIPFGWSFLSIAKVPMTWTQGDVWQAEVMLPVGQRIEYKYVILEEQDWTKLENEDSEGLVEVTYRTGTEPGKPPDVQVIQKQMAIVAWQPGPNRMVQVPTEEEMGGLQPGEVVERVPARPPARSAFEPAPQPDPFEGTSEALLIEEDGEPVVDRKDVWGWAPPATGRPAAMRGLRFDN